MRAPTRWVRGSSHWVRVRLFRYQHIGIPNAKSSYWVSKPMRGPNVLQWNIGYTYQNRTTLNCAITIPLLPTLRYLHHTGYAVFATHSF